MVTTLSGVRAMNTEATDESLPEFNRPVKVLLVDDDAAWTRGTAGLLDHAVDAFNIETATSLAEAHELYSGCEFDCIVCDYQLGDGIGLDLLESIREKEADRPFILVTGRGDEELASEAIRRDITDYVIKDHDKATVVLAQCIATAVETYRTAQLLERERRSKTALLDLLTASTDETSLCREFCSLLVETHGYACAWIGIEIESRIIARAAAGEDSYVDQVIYNPPADDSPEPAHKAFETDKPVIRQLPDTVDDNSWQALAQEYDFETAAGIPIDYDGIRLGVLGVYTTGRPTVDADRIESLSEFAETLGYALHTADFKRSLGSDRSVTVKIEISDAAAPLVSLDRSLPSNSRLVVPSVIFRDNTTLYLIRVEGASRSAITRAIEATDGIITTDKPDQTQISDQLQCCVITEESTPESLLADHGGSLRETITENGTTTVIVRLDDHRDLSTITDKLRTTYDGTVVSSVRQDPGSTTLGTVDKLLEPLTDKQRNAIEHAYHEGFFEHPRDKSATEIADQFEVTRQTLTHHLRAAERKLLDQVFDPSLRP